MMAKQIFGNPLTPTSNPVRKFSDSIPVDLLIDILSRVPGKSVARFRCVSKLWACVLDSPDFTELFNSKSSTRPRLLFTLKANGKVFFYSSPQPQNLDNDSCLEATCYHKYFPENAPSKRCTLVTRLALLRGYGSEMQAIFNPATGEFLTLPKQEAKEEFYFGYDPVSKQYKVLCRTMTSSPNGRIYTSLVLTLETGKPSWRKIDEPKFYFSIETWGDICIDGVLYVGAYNYNGFRAIVSFDIRSERFGFIKDLSLTSDHSLTLFNYKGELGIHETWCTGDRQDPMFWVLEDGENHKWSKHVHPLPFLRENVQGKSFLYYTFVGMTSRGEMVWSSYPQRANSFYLFFYNLESKKLTRVNIQGFQESKKGGDIIYVDTFLDYEENITKNSTWSKLLHTRTGNV